MKQVFYICTLLLILTVSGFTQSDSTTTYVSLTGKFYIDYPADWYQIPYREIDTYLQSKRAGRPLYNYDAVFAPKSDGEFYNGAYLFLTLDKIENISQKQIDSVMKDLEDIFGENQKYFPVADFFAKVNPGEITFDKNAKVATVFNQIMQDQQVLKDMVLFKKFFSGGIANFYFYSPESETEGNMQTFKQIVSSFGTENYQDKLPKEELKVADINTDEITKESSSKTDKEKGSYGSQVAVFVGLAVVIFLVVSRRKKKKNS
ncbi:MAG: hypothetical protein DWP97_01810 [Calditrichaeota bacterium]|nr:MAG: hypothetical protein DWP97_01810 [Calditrichota bacterium]